VQAVLLFDARGSTSGQSGRARTREGAGRWVFLIRIAFWFSLVLLALPLGPQGEAASVGPVQALQAASEALNDMTGMCDRRPEICRTERRPSRRSRARAREGARIAVGMLADKGGEQDTTATTDSMAVPE